MIDINEKQLRAAFKHQTTKSKPFSNIAAKTVYQDSLGIHHVEEVMVYGKKTKTVIVRGRDPHGNKKYEVVLGQFPADAGGYADAAAKIEEYFDLA